ncbi:MAG: very short patch repair endonuclease [Selenomonadaceae bacterium]
MSKSKKSPKGGFGQMSAEQRSYVMSRIRSHDTKAEVMLRKALWHAGLRYRKNYRKIPGTPDIALTRQKIAIFVDGDFWHARGHEAHPGEEVRSHHSYWAQKLARNVERDLEVNDALTELGWLVLRFWESEVKRSLKSCVDEVLSYAK